MLETKICHACKKVGKYNTCLNDSLGEITYVTVQCRNI